MIKEVRKSGSQEVRKSGAAFPDLPVPTSRLPDTPELVFPHAP